MKFRFFNSKNAVVKASSYNAVIVAVKVLSGIISAKIVAIFLGPTGLALIGNLRNFIQTASSLTAEGYQNGIIRYVAENQENKRQQIKITATVFQLSLAFSIIIGILLWLFSNYWSNFLFQTNIYDYIIKVIGLGLPFFSFNLLMIYVLNGLEKYRKLVIVNTVLSLGNMSVLVFMVIKYGLEGALLGAIIGPVIVFIINLFCLGKDRYWLLNIFNLRIFSFKVLKNINIYLLMAIYSTAIVSVTFLLVRNLIISNLGVVQAGYWEAMNRISGFYLMFFTSMTSFYLLPRLSKTNEYSIFKKELQSFYSISIPLLLMGLTLIYLLRFIILKLLLNQEFLPTADLFLWQLIGDFISILAIALVKQFHAKKMVKAYLICNGILNLLYFTFSYFLIDNYGVVGVVKAYTLSYTIYLVLVILFISNYFNTNSSVKTENT